MPIHHCLLMPTKAVKGTPPEDVITSYSIHYTKLYEVDHRVIDGADAGRFLNDIKSLLSDPMMLLLS